MKPAFRKAVPWLPLVIGPFLLFGIDLIRGEALFWGAPILQFTPWHTVAKEIATSGYLPLWNPWLGMGAPLLANYQSALLYPPNWILLVLDVSWGQTLLVLLHLIWAGLGMAMLSRSLGFGRFAQAISGLAYAMSGYLVARSGFLSINAAAAWLPWILYATEGLVRTWKLRAVALLGLFLGLQWLSGHAQIAWYSFLLTTIWAIYRSRTNSVPIRKVVPGFVLAGALASAIAAVQLLPTLEYVSVSNRASDLDPEFVLTYSFWPWRLLGLLAPDLYGNPRTADFWGYGNFWEDAIYMGVLPFLLAVGALFTKRIGRLKWFLLSIAAVALLFSLGRNTPVFTFLFEYVPTFSTFQAPTRWNLWLVFSFALLAGLGAEHWQVAEGRSLYWLRLGTAGAFAIMVVAAVIHLLDTSIEPTFTRAIALAGLWLAVSGLLALLRAEPIRRGWTAVALSVVVLDLFLAGRGLNPTGPTELNSAPTALSEQVSSEHRLYMSQELEREIKFDVTFRFDSFQPELDWWIVRESGLPNTTLLDQLNSTNNFDPLLPARYVSWMEQLELLAPVHQGELLTYMNVGWRADGIPTTYIPSPSMPLRAWIVPGATWAESPGEAVQLAASPEFNISDEVVLEGEPRSEQGGAGTVTAVMDFGPHLVELEAETAHGGWLVLADSWYPGWEAALDEKPIESYPANGIMRAVWVPAGQHSVTFAYRPTTPVIGLGLSLLGLAAFVVLRRK